MNKLLFLVVFISGGAVLAIEILGTRILGPYYGVSIFLWSALIGVTLIALSIGYTLGGNWADKNPIYSRLAILLICAGLWIIIIPYIKYPVLTILSPVGLRVAVLMAALILFMPPLLLLGMDTPYVVKLGAESLNNIGKTVGNLYAVSTIGSVIAALMTGYILIPNFGVTTLLHIIGSILIFIGVLIILLQKSSRLKFLYLIFLVLVLIIIVLLNKEQNYVGTVTVQQSPYAEIEVINNAGYRYLLIDGGVHSIADTISWESPYPYIAVLESAKLLFEKPGNMLLIGLGAGSLMKSFNQAGWETSAVEVDPVVIDIAHKYFGLLPDEGKVYKADGRQFIRTTKDKYDLVIIDAFGSSSIPFHLITKEVFAEILEILNKNGIVGINIESIGWHDVIVKSVFATLKEVFGNVTVLPIVEPPTVLGNVIILASNDDIELYHKLPRNYADPDFRFSSNYFQVHAWDNKFEPATQDVPILTDELNPIDIWSERINFAARKNLSSFHKEIGKSLN